MIAVQTSRKKARPSVTAILIFPTTLLSAIWRILCFHVFVIVVLYSSCVNNIKHQRGGTIVHNVLVKRQQLSGDTEGFRCFSTLRLITTEKKYKCVLGSFSLNRLNLLFQGSSIKFFVTENNCLQFQLSYTILLIWNDARFVFL